MPSSGYCGPYITNCVSSGITEISLCLNDHSQQRREYLDQRAASAMDIATLHRLPSLVPSQLRRSLGRPPPHPPLPPLVALNWVALNWPPHIRSLNHSGRSP